MKFTLRYPTMCHLMAVYNGMSILQFLKPINGASDPNSQLLSILPSAAPQRMNQELQSLRGHQIVQSMVHINCELCYLFENFVPITDHSVFVYPCCIVVLIVMIHTSMLKIAYVPSHMLLPQLFESIQRNRINMLV